MKKGSAGSWARAVFCAGVSFAACGPALAEPPAVSKSLSPLDSALREGTSAYLRGDYRDAAKIIESAVGPGGAGGAAAAGALSQLATLYWMQGRYVEAEGAVRRGLALLEAPHGGGVADEARELAKLGTVLSAEGRYAEAEAVFLKAMRLLEPVFGVDHAYVGECLHNLGELSFLAGRYPEAERRYWRAYMIRSYLHGPESSHVGETLAGLAEVYRALGREAEARSFFARALAIAEKPPRADGRWGRLDERDLLSLHVPEREQVAYRGKIYTSDGAPQHPEYALRYDSLAELYRALGRYADAGVMYQRSIALRTRAFGPQHPEIVQTLERMAEMQAEQGDGAGALQALRPAVQMMAARIASHPGERPEYARGERARWRPAFLFELALLTRGPREQQAGEEAFAALQYAGVAAGAERPLALAEARALIAPDEALVVYAADAPEGYLALVRKAGVEIRRVGADPGPQLARELAGMRRILLVADGALEGVRATRLPSVGALRHR